MARRVYRAAVLGVLSTALWLAAPALAASCPDPGSGDFKLCYVDHTGIEIAVAWDAVAEATAYVVERDTTPAFNSAAHVTYTMSTTVTGFGDTGWPLTDARRFQRPSTAATSPIYHLDSNVSYYYRISAPTAAGTRLSNTVGPHQLANYQTAGQIPRGTPGDLWADVVLGRPRFGENTWWKTDPYHLQEGAGVIVDRNTSHPTHVFLVEANHNRILGMASLGVCSVSRVPCSIAVDCTSSETCTLLPGQSAPQFVLGQPSDTDYGACNHDGTGQTYPTPVGADAGTLCFIDPTLVSVGESNSIIQPAVDGSHNLYVPDEWNHRVLMYRDPFNSANGTAAAEVWGQSTLNAALCNKGQTSATMDSLCHPTAVEIDAAGNLWVADNQNSRAQRFPYNPTTGVIATTADISLTGLWNLRSIRADPQGNVYVADQASAISEYVTPQPGQSNPPQRLTFITTLPGYGGIGAAHMDFDPTVPNRLWVQNGPSSAVLVDLAAQTLIKKVTLVGLRALGVSQAGDLFTVEVLDYNVGLYRLGATETPPQNGAGSVAFLGFGVPTLDSMMGILGITIAGNQLLVSDRFAVYFWNDYHQVTEGTSLTRPADGMWGLGSIVNGGDSYYLRSDDSGRVWINSRFSGLKLFQSPLTPTSSSIKTLTVSRYRDASGAIVPLPGGVSVAIRGFLPIGNGNRAWIADDDHARVVRLVNIDGVEAPGQLPYVDIVLGQASWSGTQCNKGNGSAGFARDTFCAEGQPSLDAQNNLFLQENASAGQDGGTTRILRWNAGTIPDNPSQTLFNVLPDSVYGNGAPGNFTPPACAANETGCPPRAAAFVGDRVMVLGGANPYVGSRFPMVYLNKEANYQPQLVLGDMMSFPSVSFVDPDGNLYLGDYDWQRVLVYKNPFAEFVQLSLGPTLTPTNTPTSTPTTTSTRTTTPTSTPTGTFTPASTPTATPTLMPASTPTQTATVTPTPSPTTALACTRVGTANPCIPGGGAAKTDCAIEWLLQPPPPLTRLGVPSTHDVCYEGDPSCDADADMQNHSCTFLVALCINNTDPRLPSCSASDLASVAVKLPRASSSKPADVENRATIESQVGNGSGGFGVTVKRGLTVVSSGLPNHTANLCSAPLPVLVPLRQARAGRLSTGRVRLSIQSLTSLGARDADSLRLDCRPSTCGDGVVQADHEECDDGNRLNGDGCDQGCHRES